MHMLTLRRDVFDNYRVARLPTMFYGFTENVLEYYFVNDISGL